MNVIAAEGKTVNSDGFIEIRTIEDLYNVRDDLTANYILMNDIDRTEATAKGGDWDFMGNGWNPIGSNDIYSNEEFSGIFDGNGHKINGLRIDVTTLPFGFFTFASPYTFFDVTSWNGPAGLSLTAIPI